LAEKVLRPACHGTRYEDEVIAKWPTRTAQKIGSRKKGGAGASIQ